MASPGFFKRPRTPRLEPPAGALSSPGGSSGFPPFTRLFNKFKSVKNFFGDLSQGEQLGFRRQPDYVATGKLSM